MHPIELENVKEALVNIGFSNLTIIEVGYVEDNVKCKESYRGKNYSSIIPKREEINIIIKHDDIKYVIDALNAIKNEDIYDNIYITPINEVIRIRTEERGEEAVE
jgi:nitrogen regulatory protein PII